MVAKRKITLGFLLFLTAVALYLSYLIFRPFLGSLLTAVVIAIVFFPLHSRITRFLRNASLAALVSTVLVTLIIIVPAVLVGIAMTREITELYGYLGEKSSESGGFTRFLMGLLERPLQLIGRYTDLSEFNLREWLLSRLQGVSGFLVSQAGMLLGNLTSFIVNGAVTLFTLFFLFREGKSMRRRVGAVLPLTSKQVEQLFDGIGRMVVATVYGGVVVALAQGALTGVGLWVCGIPSPVFWGVISAVLSLLPLVGSAIVWLPAAIYLFATGSVGYGIFLIVWGSVVVGLADNILRPLLISGRVKMHTLLIFFAVFGGVQVFGFLGLFVGPVVLAVTMTLLSMLRDESSSWRELWAEDSQDLSVGAPGNAVLAPAGPAIALPGQRPSARSEMPEDNAEGGSDPRIERRT